MKGITKVLKKRLAAQKEEAEIRGLTKTASVLDSYIENFPERENDSEYNYSEMVSDVESLIMTSAIKIQDYFQKTAEPNEIFKIIQAHADEIIDEIKIKIGGKSFGPNEGKVPGQE